MYLVIRELSDRRPRFMTVVSHIGRLDDFFPSLLFFYPVCFQIIWYRRQSKKKILALVCFI